MKEFVCNSGCTFRKVSSIELSEIYAQIDEQSIVLLLSACDLQ